MMEELVSIIIPCYNGEKTIGRCLESILAQSYRMIEVIVVNDGSKDNSVKCILNYDALFADRGIKLRLISQENKGLAGAINAGLKVFEGEYLCWIDCDDYLLKDSINQRVEFLRKNPDIAVVTSDAYYYNEKDLNNPIKKASDGLQDVRNPKQFENLLKSNAIFCCGCHMVRTKEFLDVNPTRHIYPARRGQNWQMLLPIYYKYSQAFLDEPLYAYIQYEQSMSSGDKTKKQYQDRYEEYFKIICHTLDSILMTSKERKKYLRLYKRIYYRQLFYLGISFRDYYLIIKYGCMMKFYGAWEKEDTSWIVNLIKKQLEKIL